MKNHGPKNPPPGCNLGPKYQPPCWSLVRKKNDDLAVQYEDVRVLVHTSIFSSSQVFFSFFNPWETVFKTFAIKGQIKKSCKLKKIIELILFHCNFYHSLYNTYLTNKSRGAYDVSYCNFFFRVIHVPSYTDAHISLPQAFVESDVACLRTCHKLFRQGCRGYTDQRQLNRHKTSPSHMVAIHSAFSLRRDQTLSTQAQTTFTYMYI